MIQNNDANTSYLSVNRFLFYPRYYFIYSSRQNVSNIIQSSCDVNRRSDLNVNGLCVWTTIIYFFPICLTCLLQLDKDILVTALVLRTFSIYSLASCGCYCEGSVRQSFHFYSHFLSFKWMWISFCVMKEEYHSFGTFYSNKILLQVYLLKELLLYTCLILVTTTVFSYVYKYISCWHFNLTSTKQNVKFNGIWLNENYLSLYQASFL